MDNILGPNLSNTANCAAALMDVASMRPNSAPSLADLTIPRVTDFYTQLAGHSAGPSVVTRYERRLEEGARLGSFPIFPHIGTPIVAIQGG